MATGETSTTESDFGAYLKARGLTPVQLAGMHLDEYTPMMSVGPGGARGEGGTSSFLDGIPATLLHSTYAEGRGEDARRRDFTLAVATIGEAIAFARNLSCRDRQVQDDLAHTEIARFGDSRHVPLESIEFDRRFALQAPPEIDAGWLRQLFSPGLIDFLTTTAPAGFCFELNEGHFCAAIPGRVDAADELDTFIAAASRAARRIRQEAVEGAGRATQAVKRGADPKFERLLGKVRFSEPPPNVASAANRYTRIAMRRPGNFLRAVRASLSHGPSLIVLALVAVGVGALLLGGGGIAVGANILAWMIPLGLACLFVLWFNVRRQARALAAKLGETAFVRGYASSRGLQLADPGGFQAEHAALQLPGAVRHVMVGTLPGTGIAGAIALVDSGVQKDAELAAGAAAAVQSGFMSLFGLGADDDRTYDAVVFDSSQSPGPVKPAPSAPPVEATGLAVGQSLSADLIRQAFSGIQSSGHTVLSDGPTRALVRASSRRGRSATELDQICAQAAATASEGATP